MLICHTINITRTINNNNNRYNTAIDEKKDGCYNNCGKDTQETTRLIGGAPLYACH